MINKEYVSSASHILRILICRLEVISLLDYPLSVENLFFIEFNHTFLTSTAQGQK